MKKAVILLLSFERIDMLRQTLPANIQNAGCDVDVIALDQGSKDPQVMNFLVQHCNKVFQLKENIGIGAGLNFLLKHAYDAGYDYFQFMANDILEEPGWIVEKVIYAQTFPEGKCGIISTWPGEKGKIPYGKHYYEGVEAPNRGVEFAFHPGDVIGQFMLTRSVVDKVGYFNTFGQLYAPVDNDYNARAARSGLVNFYLPGYWASHLDTGDDIYGYDKGEKVAITWPQHVANVSQYTDENSYIPFSPVPYELERVIYRKDSLDISPLP